MFIRGAPPTESGLSSAALIRQIYVKESDDGVQAPALTNFAFDFLFWKKRFRELIGFVTHESEI
jgi:hypothetical protein